MITRREFLKVLAALGSVVAIPKSVLNALEPQPRRMYDPALLENYRPLMIYPDGRKEKLVSFNIEATTDPIFFVDLTTAFEHPKTKINLSWETEREQRSIVADTMQVFMEDSEVKIAFPDGFREGDYVICVKA